MNFCDHLQKKVIKMTVQVIPQRLLDKKKSLDNSHENVIQSKKKKKTQTTFMFRY